MTWGAAEAMESSALVYVCDISKKWETQCCAYKSGSKALGAVGAIQGHDNNLECLRVKLDDSGTNTVDGNRSAFVCAIESHAAGIHNLPTKLKLGLEG